MMTSNHVLKINSVAKRFAQKQVLKDVSFNLNQGELLVLLGENGAGKTTCLSIILGMLQADDGEVSVYGYAPGTQLAKQKLGVMLQAASLPEKLKVKEQLRLFASYYVQTLQLQDVMQLAKIEDIQDLYIGALSGGQKQRLLFALAIIGKPQILILDEPTVGLDSDSRKVFWQCITQLKQQGTAIILTTHYLDEAEAVADTVVLLHDGRIVLNDTSSAIKARISMDSVSFTTSTDLAQLQRILINHKLSANAGRIEISSTDAKQILKTLFDNNIEFSDLQVKPLSLESAIKLAFKQQTTSYKESA